MIAESGVEMVYHYAYTIGSVAELLRASEQAILLAAWNLTEEVLQCCLSMRLGDSDICWNKYREEQVPRLGRMRAKVWYLRQSISFLSVRNLGGLSMKVALT